jgi:two-component system response regulator
MNEHVILLVEDDSSDEELTLRAFRRSNVASEVAVVRDGAEALDYLFGRGEYSGANARPLPHVVLLDLNLPKLGGLDVLEAIRADERTKTLPVIILTSSGEERDLRAAYALGANSYIVKPVEFSQFSETIQQLGLYWLVLNRRPTDAT